MTSDLHVYSDSKSCESTAVNDFAGNIIFNREGYITTINFKGFRNIKYFSGFNIAYLLRSFLTGLSKLTTLNLSNGGLVGSLVSEIGQITTLQILDVSSNGITGEIPIEVGQLTSLQTLSLQSNKLNGTIPTELDQLTALKSLIVYGNKLSGYIPTQLGSLPVLQSFLAYFNKLSGSLPTELGRHDSLKYLGFSGNQLTGTIPTEFGRLDDLEGLYLNSNKLVGTIPIQHCNWTDMITFDFSNNPGLNGTLPSALCDLDDIFVIASMGVTCPVSCGYKCYQPIKQTFAPSTLSTAVPTLSPIDVSKDLSLLCSYLLTINPPVYTDINVCESKVINDFSEQIYFDSQGYITAINAQAKSVLYGQNIALLITTFLSQLSNLQILILSNNGLIGSISSEIGRITTLLYLDLSRNSIDGTIPTELGLLTSMQTLTFASNQITGSIPTEIGQLVSLQFLELTDNQLDGVIPIEIKQVTTLNSLFLNNNHLNGDFPTELCQLTALQTLSLGVNELLGTLPTELGTLTMLTNLDLDNNYFTENIPTEIGQLTLLQYLLLHNNQLTNIIPTELGQLTSLLYLNLFSNQLSGFLFTELGNLKNLQTSDFSNNKFTGSIPTYLGQLTSIQTLVLAGNTLNGSIPTELGQLKQLQSIDLNSNDLTGSLPSEIGNLQSLSYIYFNDNQLDGVIPTQIGNLYGLKYFDFSNNHYITGTLPLSLCNLTHVLVVTSIGVPCPISCDSRCFQPLEYSPTMMPSVEPTLNPSFRAVVTKKPIRKSTMKPTTNPSLTPIEQPTSSPTSRPSGTPTIKPSQSPSCTSVKISAPLIGDIFGSFCYTSSPSNYVSAFYLYGKPNVNVKLPDNMIHEYTVDSLFAPNTYLLSPYNNHRGGIYLDSKSMKSSTLNIPTSDVLYLYYDIATKSHFIDVYTGSKKTITLHGAQISAWSYPTISPTLMPSLEPSFSPSGIPSISTNYPTYDTTSATSFININSKPTCTIIDIDVPFLIEETFLTFCYANSQSNYVSSVYVYDNPTFNIKKPDDAINGYVVDSMFDPNTYLFSTSNNHEGGINLDARQLNSPIGDILYLYYDSATNGHVMEIYTSNNNLVLTIDNVQISSWTCKNSLISGNNINKV